MLIAGKNARVWLTEDRIKIYRYNLGSPRTEELWGKYIMLSQISSIQFKNAGILKPGYIHFVLTGEKESEEDLLAKFNENTVVFDFTQRKSFQQFKEALEIAITTRSRLESLKSSELAELEKFSRLKDQGVITEEEFNQKKKQLLGL